jgi:biotin carboxylase
MTHILMIGYSRAFLAALQDQVPEHSVTVIEEPQLHASRPPETTPGVLRRLVLAPYQQHGAYLAAARRLHRCDPVQAVLPGLEYAVLPAARVAEDLRLPGAGVPAARALRNKLLLRRRTHAHGLPTPAFAELRSEADLRRFAAAHGRIVLKPTDRQASLGVQRLAPGADLATAWATTRDAQETGRVVDRPMRRRYLAEQWITGPEFSTEAIVRNGVIRFFNITAKTTLAGPRPVELGHTLPASLPPSLQTAFRHAHAALIAAVGYRTGILHAEWILTGQTPMLIECAGRAPGDKILDLMELSYGFSLYRAVIDLHLGRSLPHQRRPRQAVAIRFLTAPPGRVRSVVGVETSRAQAGVNEAVVAVHAGEVVRPVGSSWDRVGHVIATAPSYAAASDRADQAAAQIAIDTGPRHPLPARPDPAQFATSLAARDRNGGKN